jgi:apolipoprotein N-acyltransferase
MITTPRQKNNTVNAGWIKPILIHLGLVIAASFLFAASFPNIIFKNGIPILAWFAYIPVLILIPKYSIISCAGWGAVFGLFSYSLFNYWLGAFHPLAGTIVNSIYLVYMAIVFVFFKLADILFPKKAYLVQWLIFLAYEYLRTLGFLGYTYGITGYSQWRVIPLIQIASITGVWGVSALVTFPSFWLAAAIKNINFNSNPTTNHTNTHEHLTHKFSSFFLVRVGSCGSWLKILKFNYMRIPAIIWVTALCGTLVFGVVSMKDFSSYPQAKIALIQHNTDPWEASKAPNTIQVHEAYRKDLEALKRLSDEALAAESGLQLVVWPETAFVPRIYWHLTYRMDQDFWLLTRDLLTYLSTKDVPFLLGNDDARMEPAKNPNRQENNRVDYNAALLFENGQISGIYRKLHLVPFTEHFPYKKQLPFIYAWLEKADTHFWEKGEEETVFSIPGFTFSTPICFEDTFGYLSRNFVRRSADVLVNISNDAWSKSLSAQNQHLAQAVFRAVENYRPMVRSTASGQTCARDPSGIVTSMAEPFTEAWLNVSVPIVKKTTIYTLYGDYFAIILTIAAAVLLIFGAFYGTIQKSNKGSGK